MSLSNPEKVVTEERLSEFYKGIYPYLNGSAHAGFTPVGTIISVMGVNAPQNYLACNGQVVNIADYPELADYFNEQFGSSNYFGGDGTTTFGIPDLRGEFLRGTGTNSHANQGSGSAVGTHQDASWLNMEYQNANSKVRAAAYDPNGLDSTGYFYLVNNSDSNLKTSDGANRKAQTITYTGEITGNYPVIGQTTRPTNTSVLYCIAIKNIYVDARYDYSTEEKIVGTWIDGKPLYQKTFTDITIPTTTDAETVNLDIDITDLNLGNVVSIDGVIFNPMQIQHTLKFPAILDTSREICTAMIATANSGANKYLRIINTSSTISGRRAYVTIQYTKTTD